MLNSAKIGLTNIYVFFIYTNPHEYPFTVKIYGPIYIQNENTSILLHSNVLGDKDHVSEYKYSKFFQ